MLINFKLTYMSVVSLSSGEKRVFTGEITLHTKIKTIAVKNIMTTAEELMIILKKTVYLSELSSSTFLLPSIPYTSWQANFWKSTLTQDWLSTFLSIVLRKFIFPLNSHQLSTRHCPISYSFYEEQSYTTSWILTKTLTLFTKDVSQEYFAFRS